jgi:ABC-type transport system substrate-binding protein
MGESVAGYLAAVGIRTQLRTMERAAFYTALGTKKLHGVCVCINAVYGNAASRLSETIVSGGVYTYGTYPDIEALYQKQALETDRRRREALLRQIQEMIAERTRIAPIMDYFWPSGLGPRVESPALMLIDPFPWAAPLEELRLKKK